MGIGQLQMLTAYSLLASTNRIDELVAKSKAYGYEAIAITDINAMHGAVEFYRACRKEDIRPILGLTLEYQSAHVSDEVFRIILLAENVHGYHQLMKISTAKMEQSPADTFQLRDIADYLEDVIVIVPQHHSELGAAAAGGYQDKLPDLLAEWEELFADVPVYGGVAVHRDEDAAREQWVDFCDSRHIPLAAVQDVRYLYPSDDFSVKVLSHIQQGTQLSLDMTDQTGPYYLPTADEMAAKFKRAGLDRALDNLEQIVAACQVELPLHQKLLPEFPVPEGETAHSYLRRLCETNLPLRIADAGADYHERLDMELSVIHDMGYDDYFLIVWDVMAYAHSRQIVTACRGSAAGSLVSYVLSITDVDPIQYGLLFERFLNKERYTMPDIDMDIPDNRRDELLQYVNRKYGHHHVAQIATFGTLAAKMALRDVTRVFGLSQSEANQWSNAVPNVLKITLQEAVRSSRKLQQLVETSDRNRLLFDTACAIEGLPRHVSTHAAGVVISDRDLTQLIPLQEGANGIPLTQFAMGDVEAIGLLKMDFLGLRNLSIIGDTLTSIEKRHGKRIDIKQIPLDDEQTLALFRRGDTVGVFQFESAGIKNVLRKLQPTSIEDIASVNALYRPGPMENIDLFIKRKHGKAPISYPHENLKSILDVTYGIIVYQEQIMQVASKMAGFTLGQADILRRAISKKEKDVLDRERQHFVEGSLQQGYSEAVANQVYDYIERFANYGFNRSHAVVYSVIAYQMAYLKVHYPSSFFASLLHSVRHNLPKIKEYIAEAKRFGVTVDAPDINKSDYSFYLNQNSILFGFSSLKGMRRDFIQNILAVRREGGRYKSLDNFLLRIDRKWLKEDNILPLIHVGAFDSLHSNRKQLVMELDGLIRNIQYSGGSMDLLDMLTLKKEPVADYSMEEKLKQEEHYLGTYLSGHPVDEYKFLRLPLGIQSINQIVEGQTAALLLYVKNVRKIRTKKGESMAFVEGDDDTGDLSVTVFPKLFRQIGMQVEMEQVYVVTGKVERSRYNQNIQLIADTCRPAASFEDKVARTKCYLKIEETNDTPAALRQLKDILMQHGGNIPVILFYEKNNTSAVLDEKFWVNDSAELKAALGQLLHESHVVFK